jgi:hypothetical protein
VCRNRDQNARPSKTARDQNSTKERRKTTKITLPEFLKGPLPGVATDQDSRDPEQESPIEYICTHIVKGKIDAVD